MTGKRFIILPMNKILSPVTRAEFEKLVRKTRNIDEKDRLRAVLAYDLGHDVSDIAEILQISESSTYNYISGSHHDNQTQDLRGFPVLKNIL